MEQFASCRKPSAFYDGIESVVVYLYFVRVLPGLPAGFHGSEQNGNMLPTTLGVLKALA